MNVIFLKNKSTIIIFSDLCVTIISEFIIESNKISLQYVCYVG